MRGPLPDLSILRVLCVLAFVGLCAIFALSGFAIGWIIDHVTIVW